MLEVRNSNLKFKYDIYHFLNKIATVTLLTQLEV